MPVEVGTVVQCLYCGSYFLSVIGTVKTPAEYGGGRIAQLAHERALTLLQRGNVAGASAVTTATVRASNATKKALKKIRQRTRLNGLSRDQIERKLDDLMQMRQQDDAGLFLGDSVDKADATDNDQGETTSEEVAPFSVGESYSKGGSSSSSIVKDRDRSSSCLWPAQQQSCSPGGASRLLACPKCGCLASGMSFDDYVRSRRETVLTHCMAVAFPSPENLSSNGGGGGSERLPPTDALSPLYVLQGSQNVVAGVKKRRKAPKWILRLGNGGPQTLDFDKRSKSTLIYAPSLRRFGVPIPANGDDALLEASGGSEKAYAMAVQTLEHCVENARQNGDSAEAHTPYCLCAAVDIAVDSPEGRARARLTPLILQRGRSKQHPGHALEPVGSSDLKYFEQPHRQQEATDEVSSRLDAAAVDETGSQKLSPQQRQKRLIEKYMYDDEDEVSNEDRLIGDGNLNRRRVDWSSESSSSSPSSSAEEDYDGE